MDSCHIWVETIDLFNKHVRFVSNLWNLFDLSDPFDQMTFYQYTFQTLDI